MILRGRTMFAPTIQSLNFTNRQKKNQILRPLFLLHMQAQKKKLSKRKRRHEISRSAERDRRRRRLAPPFEKGGRKLQLKVRETLSVCDTKKVGVRYEKRKSPRISFFCIYLLPRSICASRRFTIISKATAFFPPSCTTISAILLLGST